jgi:hypothetical protein
MPYSTIALMIVSAFASILSTVMVFRAHHRNRLEEMAPFRDYFGAEYDRDLLRQSSWCDDENLDDHQNRIDSQGLRDRNADEKYSRSGVASRWNRDRD